MFEVLSFDQYEQTLFEMAGGCVVEENARAVVDGQFVLRANLKGPVRLDVDPRRLLIRHRKKEGSRSRLPLPKYNP